MKKEAKEVWDVTKGYIDNSNDPLSLGYLIDRLHSEFGQTIEKSNWFGMASLRAFVYSSGGQSWHPQCVGIMPGMWPNITSR